MHGKVRFYSLVVMALAAGLLVCGCRPEPTQVVPTPQFEHTPQNGTAPLRVSFRDTSTPGKTPIQAWLWQFGDGATSNLPSPTHEYLSPGVYSVSLTITTVEGDFTHRTENAVEVRDSGEFGGPGDDGSFSAEGVTITVPQPLIGKVVFGIRVERGSTAIDAFEDMTILSNTFVVSHNLNPPDLFTYDAKGRTNPTRIAVRLSDSFPVEALHPGAVQLLARMPDNRTVPIPGRVRGPYFVSNVLRLPERAYYVLALRPQATNVDTRQLEDLYNERLEAEDDWADYWVINLSRTTMQQLTALYRGNIGNEAGFHRRDYPDNVVQEAVTHLGASAQGLHNMLADSGLRVPTLVAENEYTSHNVLLFNMYSDYPYTFDSVSDLVYQDTFFGHVVLDPAQLLAISIRNAREAAAYPEATDIRQKFSSSMAFSEALMKSVYPSYRIPNIVTTGDAALGLARPADRDAFGRVKPIHFAAGILDGGALFLGQTAEERLARGFGENEYSKLSDPLFFPYSASIPGYSLSGHEFYCYLQRDGDFEEPLLLLAGYLEGLRESLDEMDEDFIRTINFPQALMGSYLVLDEVIAEIMEDVADAPLRGLREYYWQYARDRAYENGDRSLLRDSDNLRPAFSLNEDRFDERAVARVAFEGPVDSIALTAGDYSPLQSIPPLTSRVIVLDVHTLTTELRLDFDAAAWNRDEDGFGLAVKVYKDGDAGLELDAPAGIYRDYTLEDTDDDGINDAIVVKRLVPDEGDCFNRVIVLISNLHLTEPNSLNVTATASSDLIIPEFEVLRRYVTACDPLYDYSLRRYIAAESEGITAYLLRMTSGSWRGSNEVDQTVWEHSLVIVEPDDVRENTALLFVSGGRTGSEPDVEDVELLAPFAKATRSIVALLTAVPNQPLQFFGELRTRSEDAIIAYSYDQYMNSYAAGRPDMTWPVLLPMTRAAVRAMDTVQAFMAAKPGQVQVIDNFVVAGASKRGWTTWLAAAADPRVSAVMPMVIDVLKMEDQMLHHRKAYASYPLFDDQNRIYGGYSTSIRDYVALGVFERFGAAEGQSLLKIVDPYRYRSLLTIPKLIANSTGDQFFLPDSSRFYFNDLPGVKYLNYAPNTDHSLTDGVTVDPDTFRTLLAFYMAHVRNMNRFASDDVSLPSYSWDYPQDVERLVRNPQTGAMELRRFARIRVEADREPLSVRVWTGHNPSHRDFRMQSIGPTWVSSNLISECERQAIEIGEPIDCATHPGRFTYIAEVPVPEEGEGWRGFLVQLKFAGPDPAHEANHVFSTSVRVVPDVYPAPYQ